MVLISFLIDINTMQNWNRRRLNNRQTMIKILKRLPVGALQEQYKFLKNLINLKLEKKKKEKKKVDYSCHNNTPQTSNTDTCPMTGKKGENSQVTDSVSSIPPQFLLNVPRELGRELL